MEMSEKYYCPNCDVKEILKSDFEKREQRQNVLSEKLSQFFESHPEENPINVLSSFMIYQLVKNETEIQLLKNDIKDIYDWIEYQD